MTSDAHNSAVRITSLPTLVPIASSPANLQRLRDAIGPLTNAAMRRLDNDLPLPES